MTRYNMEDYTTDVAPYDHDIAQVTIKATPERAEQAVRDLAVYGYEPADTPVRT